MSVGKVRSQPIVIYLKGTTLRLALVSPTKSRLGWESPPRDTHFSLSPTMVNYNLKKFYDIWPGVNVVKRF
jgi:hypothetical protein